MFFTQILNCPPSLKLILQVYRYGGFSCSGIGFGKKGKDGYFHPGGRNIAGGLFLFWQLICILNIATVGSLNIYYSFTDPSQWSNESLGYFEDSFREGVKMYRAEYIFFKPILRIVLQCIVIVFVIDNFINCPLNLITGGRLIEKILRIPNIRQLDCNRHLGIKLLATPFLLVLFSYILGNLFFQRKKVPLIWEMVINGQSFSSSQVDKILSPAIAYPMFFTIQSVTSIFYIYTMTMIHKNIRKLASELPQSISERELEILKSKLAHLQEVFSSIKSHLSLSLTWVSIGNIYIIIASICYLIIVPVKEHQFSAVVLTYLTFVLGRLFALCVAGQWPSSAMESLIIQTFEKLDNNWTLDRWMAFKEIRKLRKPFQSNIWGVYTIDQSTILTVLGFALGYIVVLLQTESFSAETLSEI